MMMASVKVNRDYAIDVAFFYKVRHFSDGLTAFSLDVGFDWYRGDHNPQFAFVLTVFNFMLFDFRVYNTHHVPEESTCSTSS